MAVSKKLAIALAMMGLLSGVAQAALFDRGGGLIYDDALNITWLSDANYAVTQGQGDTWGRMQWTSANTWAANLSYRGYDDWRLPTALNQNGTGPCTGHNCANSEIGHLFYSDLGGIAGQDILTSSDPDIALFKNIQGIYWTGTASAPDGSIYPKAWVFLTVNGVQYSDYQGYDAFAWAVRDGDVASVGAPLPPVAAPIPEPETYAMMLAGLSLLGFMARRRKLISVA